MAANKIVKDKGVTPDAFELDVAQALFDLESNSSDLKAELRELYIVSAKEVDVAGRKAVVLFVPYRLLKLTHKIQSRLVRELEKKFSGKHVVVIAQRRIQRQEAKSGRTLKQKRPVSRTLTSVHDAILEDLVYPTEIVGKHTRYRNDGSKLLKIYLDPKESSNVEYKLDTFGSVYKKLTGKEASFEFPVTN
jgi:small subunit ribosomal protein S7e